MGTRNKTELIYNGEKIINQYGQWDGYPGTGTNAIVEQINKGYLEKVISNVNLLNYVTPQYVDTVIFGKVPEQTFAPYSDRYNKFEKDRYKINVESEYKIKLPDLIAKLMEKYDHQYVADVFTLTRDTGYNIIEVIAILLDYDVKVNIYKSDYEGFDIEAINTIDYDNKKLNLIWHDEKRTWTFDDLPNLEELKALEKY